MNKKIKVLTISDNPLSFSGVGIVTRHLCESLLKSDKFSIVSLGGSINPPNLQPIRTEQYKEDWTVYPVKGMGNIDVVRSLVRMERPDILLMISDPRFYIWLWMIEQEIRPLLPMTYLHVWDNYPPPSFNRKYYLSTDVIMCISKLTEDIVGKVAPEVERHYFPHAIDPDIFKKLPEEEVQLFKEKHFGKNFNKSIIFFNSRNARRKQSGTLIFWFKEFLDIVGREQAVLVMHTDPKDPNGPDLDAIVQELGLTDGEVRFSTGKLPPEQMALWYNSAICTVNPSDAEGFGLSTSESLACETPIICTMTGGLKEQVTDGENWFGVGIEPGSKMIVGSQEIPFIYEDRINKQDFVDALKKIHIMSPEARAVMGAAGRQHLLKNYNHQRLGERYVDLMLDIHARYGSWETRKGYKPYRFIEV